MFLSSLTLENYRNYHQLSCSFCPGVNLVTGANAQGKTNLIESIYYLSIGKAYRQARDAQLVQWGKEAFQIRGEVESKRGRSCMAISFRHQAHPAKVYSAGGLTGIKMEDLSGTMISVLFSPENMSIIKGSPMERRSFLDYDISQISVSYHKHLSKYRRLLAQRNALIKKIRFQSATSNEKKERLWLWDQQLIDCGAAITVKRLSFLERMAPMARLTHRKLTEGKENLELHYMFSTREVIEIRSLQDKEQQIRELLLHAREFFFNDDLRLGSTNWGPHRDDVRFALDGTDIRLFGSQGQQRTSVLAVKIAELEVFRGESGEYPVLLLDDVLSELDEDRQQQLMQIINDKPIQCIITATDAKHLVFPDKRERKSFAVRAGKIDEI